MSLIILSFKKHYVECQKEHLNISNVLVSSIKAVPKNNNNLKNVKSVIYFHDEFLFNELLQHQNLHVLNVSGDGNYFFHAVK